MPRYQDSGRCQGYAHVSFNSEEAYNYALTRNKEYLNTRYLLVQPSEGPKTTFSKEETERVANAMPADCKTLFVKNLPYEFKEDDIGDRFRKFGEI